MNYSERYSISGPGGSLPVVPVAGQYPPQQTSNSGSPQNFLGNSAIQSTLFSAGGGALGSALAGPWGGALGAGAAPIVQSFITPQKEPWNQILTQAALAAVGGGLGSAVVKGPIGGGLGGGAGGYLGYQLAQRV